MPWGSNYDEVVAKCHAEAQAKAVQAAKEAIGWYPPDDTYQVIVSGVDFNALPVERGSPVALLAVRVTFQLLSGIEDVIGKNFWHVWRWSSPYDPGQLTRAVNQTPGPEVTIDAVAEVAAARLVGSGWAIQISTTHNEERNRDYHNVRFVEPVELPAVAGSPA